MTNLPWQVEKIIAVSKELNQYPNSRTPSDSERIAAAFVLDEPGLLPDGYSMIDAFDRLDDWQMYVRQVRKNYMHLVK